jgi:hypothetical protein
MRPSNTTPDAKTTSIARSTGPRCRTASVCAGQSLCGAPRRNRTGDPILTMESPGTAVRNPVFPGHARPSGAKLSVLLPRSYAFTDRRALIISGAGRNHTSSCWVGGGCDPNQGSQSAIATAGLAIGPLERFEQVNSPTTGPFPLTLRKAIRSGTQPLPGSRPKARRIQFSYRSGIRRVKNSTSSEAAGGSRLLRLTTT